MSPIGATGSGDDLTVQTEDTQQLKKAQEDAAKQVSANKNALEEVEENSAGALPAKGAKKDKPIETRSENMIQRLKEMKANREILPLAQLNKDAAKHQKDFPEHNAKTLVILRQILNSAKSPEEILNKLSEYYDDPLLKDQALDFLIKTSESQKELQQIFLKAKDLLNDPKVGFGREIIAGRNIQAEAQAAADKGLGTPTNMRMMYYDLTNRNPNAQTLFDELSKKYNYKDLTKVANFLLHSLGADLKAGGPNIERGYLHDLYAQVKTLQAIKGVYRFFENRMPLITKLFSSVISSAYKTNKNG